MLENKNIMNYFKDEKSFYEYAILFTDGQYRMNLLKMSRVLYGNKKASENWYLNIREKIEDKKAIDKLEKIYMNMIR